MLIRPAREEDIDALVEMGARMHAEGYYSFLRYDREKVRRLMRSCIDDIENQCGFVAEHGNVIVGMLGGYLTDYFFCDERLACDWILFVDREWRGSSAAARLIKAFRNWASGRAAQEICLGVSTNVDTERVGRFYEKMGLTRVGGVYKQRLG
jgi:GNAT superfamily N-acetyltransferase